MSLMDEGAERLLCGRPSPAFGQQGSNMARYEFDKPRLYVDADLASGARLELAREQANYLRNVLRLGSGDEILIFNGRDGEWLAQLEVEGRKSVRLSATKQVRPQAPKPGLDYIFAPLKHARLDYMVQKATEMGAGRLLPVMTRRTQVSRVNLERMRANAIEAAEQCGILALPEVLEPQSLEALIRDWPTGIPLIFCDEDAAVSSPLEALRELATEAPARPMALLIGPEGGFAPEERTALMAMPESLVISLGPRILRADTAAVAALAVLQAAAGDW
jgi:16S rRNA (uracil1498-N3)-methyltransferase